MRLLCVVSLTALLAIATANAQPLPETLAARGTVEQEQGGAWCRLGRMVGTLRDSFQRRLCQTVSEGAKQASQAIGGVTSALHRFVGSRTTQAPEAMGLSVRAALGARATQFTQSIAADSAPEHQATRSSGLGAVVKGLVGEGRRALRHLRSTALDLKDKLDAAREHLPPMWVIKQRLTNPEAKKWTVFVYMNADNDLHNNGLKDLQEMAQVGSNKDMNIVVLWDGAKTIETEDGQKVSTGDEARSKLLYVEKGKIKELKDLGELNMGHPETLTTGVVTAMKQFPAERTALVAWNHGLGWSGVSFDDEPECNMSMSQFSDALNAAAKQTGRNFDVLGFDACLMNMAEVNYQNRKLAKYLVGSEETEPKNGWDYKALLGTLARNPTMDGKEFACTVVDTYAKGYNNGSQGDENVCLSAIDLGNFDRSFRRLDDFARALKEEADKGVAAQNNIRRAAHCSQRFEEATCMDLVDFTKRLSSTTSSPEVKQYGERLASFLTEEVVIRNAAVGDKYQDAHGMSIYFPRDLETYRNDRADYNELAMTKDSCWRDLLDVCVTRGGRAR